MRQTVRRIGVLSLGKVMGIVYAAFGLLAGALISVLSLFGAFAAESEEAFFGLIFGVGAIVVLPIFYGVLAFLMGMLLALVYNAAARAIGGLEVELG